MERKNAVDLCAAKPAWQPQKNNKRLDRTQRIVCPGFAGTVMFSLRATKECPKNRRIETP